MFFTWMVTLFPALTDYVFVKHRSLPKAEFVLRLHDLSSTDPEPLSEIKPIIFVSFLVFF